MLHRRAELASFGQTHKLEEPTTHHLDDDLAEQNDAPSAFICLSSYLRPVSVYYLSLLRLLPTTSLLRLPVE
jgi:hypothetical protein